MKMIIVNGPTIIKTIENPTHIPKKGDLIANPLSNRHLEVTNVVWDYANEKIIIITS